MTKTRVTPPTAIRNAVMGEFNHKCAICGKERPQVHHIDEDPPNNDPLNLIPLCPNCHLVDLHNPTGAVDPAKIRIFREYKDPAILTPQFHPLFMRLKFLDHVSDVQDEYELQTKVQELVDFVAELEMGAFYSKQIKKLAWPEQPIMKAPWNLIKPEESMFYSQRQWQIREYRKQLCNTRDKVIHLVVELLRFQNWSHAKLPRPAA